MKKIKKFRGVLIAALSLGVLLSGCSGGPANLSPFESAQRDTNRGDPVAQFNLGVMYHKGEGVARDLQTAAKWYGLSAEQGWPAAETNLGHMYYNGQGVKQDKVEALKLYRSAANNGDGLAFAKVAFVYYKGEDGVLARDVRKAAEWMRKAAEKDVPEAQAALGVMYLEGDGVAQDSKEALRWLHPAALRGQELAQYNLGRMYDQGNGVPADKKEAYIWYSLAKENGVDEAALHLLSALLSLSVAEMKAANAQLSTRREEILKRQGSDDRTWNFH